MSEKECYVYVLANQRYGTLYVGCTTDLIQRICEHKNKVVEAFTKKYNVTQLVYFEPHAGMQEALLRERQIKKWKRDWKINLIEQDNPYWIDLYDEILG